ncbi:MAG: Xaa-Pro peptidase family protein [Armatimonadota bacterium]|nr:Xaa-Pro peptidase family protein [Armatimonadota bacterium]MDR7471820.1 Xaa-Pro peptidase family protein [Armatimonadota bacterium]
MRLDAVLRDVRDAGLDALLVSTPANTYYVSGFRAVIYSRPVLVVVTDHPVLIVPELELAHARQRSRIADVRAYSDADLGGLEGRSPLHLALDCAMDALRELELHGRRVGFEPGGLTAEGHAYLAERWGHPLQPARGVVERRRMVKDRDEIRLIRISAELAELGMRVEVESSRPGVSEIEIMARGDAAMLVEAARRYPEHHVTAGSRPVSGDKTVLPHSLPSGRRLRRGDVVIHGTGCATEGYHAEDERTMIVGPPTAAQRQLYELMVRAQQAALEAIRPGVPCSAVDRAARRVIDEAGYGHAFIHRTGHGLGIDIHELPFFAPGDHTVLAPGMVMSVEPGIYVEGVGGFRHSDTVVVTEEGCEILTRFPKSLDELSRP